MVLVHCIAADASAASEDTDSTLKNFRVTFEKLFNPKAGGAQLSATLSPNTAQASTSAQVQDLNLALYTKSHETLSRARLDLESNLGSCTRATAEASYQLHPNTLASACIGVDVSAPFARILPCSSSSSRNPGVSAGLAVARQQTACRKIAARWFAAESVGQHVAVDAVQQVGQQQLLQLGLCSATTGSTSSSNGVWQQPRRMTWLECSISGARKPAQAVRLEPQQHRSGSGSSSSSSSSSSSMDGRQQLQCKGKGTTGNPCWHSGTEKCVPQQQQQQQQQPSLWKQQQRQDTGIINVASAAAAAVAAEDDTAESSEHASMGNSAGNTLHDWWESFCPAWLRPRQQQQAHPRQTKLNHNIQANTWKNLTTVKVSTGPAAAVQQIAVQQGLSSAAQQAAVQLLSGTEPTQLTKASSHKLLQAPLNPMLQNPSGLTSTASEDEEPLYNGNAFWSCSTRSSPSRVSSNLMTSSAGLQSAEVLWSIQCGIDPTCPGSSWCVSFLLHGSSRWQQDWQQPLLIH